MGLGPIPNGNSVLLTQNTGTLPDMNDALLSYFQPMTFEVVIKTVVGFDVQETSTPVTFQGVWQPQTPQMLSMKPEGQRKWKWYTVHADPSLDLTPDDVIVYLGNQYRVMNKLDYKIYGYNQFELIDDYSGSGPTT